MLKNSFAAVTISSLFVVLSAGCAHQQTVTLTSAAAAAPAPAAQPAPAAPVAEAVDDEEDTDATEAKSEAPKPAAKKPGEPMSFAELGAQLGGDEKIDLAMGQSTPVAGKGLSSDGYSAVTGAHQAVDTGTGARTAGDIKLSGGLTATAVRAGVHEGAARLRACYERGLAVDPRLAGRVMVSFSVNEHGGVSDVEAQSDAIPEDVRSCIRSAFSAMTFAAPKAAPAKIVYPIDFNKDS
jgi:outer membrane biosynthesis protein TonB